MNKIKNNFKIFNLEINNINHDRLLYHINNSINSKSQISITGVNVSTLNLVYRNEKNFKVFSTFNILHPDGIGVFLASKFLGKGGYETRITGSDFYKELSKSIINKEWKVFFFGDEESTLEKVKIKNPNMKIVGVQNGFNYSTKELLKKINISSANILIVGLGAPKQEKWILKNKSELMVPVILSVGEGIKIFAGNKVRGFKIVRKFGLEWFIRLINNPKMYWRRYILGIPLFIFRFIKCEVIKIHDI